MNKINALKYQKYREKRNAMATRMKSITNVEKQFNKNIPKILKKSYQKGKKELGISSSKRMLLGK